MASEAQRIMNLSLTKIVSSRSRRGGVSLHRNLLVASVLFKARDVYAAEVAGLVVVRDGCVYDRDSVGDFTDQEPEVDVNDNEADDASRIRDEQVMETANAVVLKPPPASDPTHNLDQVESPTSDVNGEPNGDLESRKENVEPLDSSQKPTECSRTPMKPKRSRKLPRKQCRKRRYTEVEQAVLSIAEQDEDCVLGKMTRVETASDDTVLDCHELSTSLPEWTDNRVEPISGNQYCSTEYQSCTDISKNNYSSCMCDGDGDQEMYEDVGSYQSSYRSFSDDCCSSPPPENITFALSHSMLVVSV